MNEKKNGQKGYDLEELLRAYFIRSGYFVLRGIPVVIDGEDATDVDIWLYERPTGRARRRQIVDAKFKQKPKASERLFWTKGLSQLLEVDDAFVATTDKRRSLRVIAQKLGVTLIDGTDLDRMKKSDRVLFPNRMTEEELKKTFTQIDLARKNKFLNSIYSETKSCVATKFGAPAINIALGNFAQVARECVTSYQNSDSAVTHGRLAYFCAAIAAAALDFVSIEEPFKSTEERREIFSNAVRFGFSSKEAGTERLRLATTLIRHYVTNGSAVASTLESRVLDDFSRIPAEIIADQSVRMSSNGHLFESCREFEKLAFSHHLPSFDDLEIRDKAFLGALLDFSGISREDFAKSWNSKNTKPKKANEKTPTKQAHSNGSGEPDLGPLFHGKEGED